MIVTVIGAGAVGSAAAYEIARLSHVNVGLYDIDIDRARGRVMDIAQAIEYPHSISHLSDLRSLAESDLCVVTAGIARGKGMTRTDLITANNDIVGAVAVQIARVAPSVPTLIVTNPSEALVQIVRTRQPMLNVFGFGCSLDQWRFRRFIADRMSCSAERVRAIVMGMHSDAMIPLSRLATVDGIPLSELLPDAEIAILEERTRTAGTAIVEALGDHSGFIAAGRAIAELVDSFLHDAGGVYPLSVMSDGAYGLPEACLALPTVFLNGTRRPVYPVLTEDERDRLSICAEKVTDTVLRIVGST